MGNKKLKKIFQTVCIASDHAGFNLKEEIKNHLIDKNISIFDLGPFNDDSVDYPDFGYALTSAINDFPNLVKTNSFPILSSEFLFFKPIRFVRLMSLTNCSNPDNESAKE